jgi:hypothetical protein
MIPTSTDLFGLPNFSFPYRGPASKRRSGFTKKKAKPRAFKKKLKKQKHSERMRLKLRKKPNWRKLAKNRLKFIIICPISHK